MIQVDNNTKQTQLYKNYMELVEFLHNEHTCCLMEHCPDDFEETYLTFDKLLRKNPL